MAKWIWKFGEFECWHNLLVHNRRTLRGKNYPPVWKVHAPDTVVKFTFKGHVDAGEMRIYATGDHMTECFCPETEEYRFLPGAEKLTLTEGNWEIYITVSCMGKMCALYVEGAVETNENWTAEDLACPPEKAACLDAFDRVEKSPLVFPFAYRDMPVAAKELMDGGVLFDFGRETFCRTEFVFSHDGEHGVYFGESREEALDKVNCILSDRVQGIDAHFPPQAFRYIFVTDANARVTAQYEYLPLAYRGSFRSGDRVLDHIWDAAAYTFHLNSREFLLDGIKRDRWVWSGDVYQSLFVNRYLFMDEQLEQRSLTALAGKPPFTAHMNNIVDYTFIWFLSLYEHYMTFGNRDYLDRIFPRAEEIMAFCIARADEDGLIRGKKRDWVFIDWAEMDKCGALCGEQVLFARALECFADLCDVCQKAANTYRAMARDVQDKVKKLFYDREKQAFIDSYESGKRYVSRQCNILCYLFLPMTKEEKRSIYEHVILNDQVAQITTPYFKFYENQVRCLEGGVLEDELRSYYGAMLDTGATSLYEAFDPTQKGIEHYAMYEEKFGKSLCHAWSASPIYLMGCFRAGVKPTRPGYAAFDVAPAAGALKAFQALVPLPGGKVEVNFDGTCYTAFTDCEGGTLVRGDARIPMEKGKTYTFTV